MSLYVETIIRTLFCRLADENYTRQFEPSSLHKLGSRSQNTSENRSKTARLRDFAIGNGPRGRIASRLGIGPYRREERCYLVGGKTPKSSSCSPVSLAKKPNTVSCAALGSLSPAKGTAADLERELEELRRSKLRGSVRPLGSDDSLDIDLDLKSKSSISRARGARSLWAPSSPHQVQRSTSGRSGPRHAIDRALRSRSP